MSGVVYWCVWALFNGLARLFFRFRVEGIEHFPKNGGIIVAANHASYLDIPLLGCAIRRRVFFLGRDNLFSNHWLNRILQWLGWIPLKTHRLDRKAFEQALSYLNSGIPVVIFPEGTRTEDAQLQQGRPGIGYLVSESQCQVIPVYISGTFKVLSVKAKWPKFFPVSVSFGHVVSYPRDESQKAKAYYEKVSASVMDHVSRVGGVSPPHSRVHDSCGNNT